MKEGYRRAKNASYLRYLQQQIHSVPSHLQNDVTLRTRTPPRQRHESAFYQPPTNLDKAAAADTEEYLVIQSDAISRSESASVLTTKSLRRAKKKRTLKKTTSAAEIERRDSPPVHYPADLANEITGTETADTGFRRSYTSFLDNSDDKIHPIEWNAFIKSVTCDVKTAESQAAQTNEIPIETRQENSAKNFEDDLETSGLATADELPPYPFEERTYTNFLNQADDNGRPLEWNDLIEPGKTDVAANMQPEPHLVLLPEVPDDSAKEVPYLFEERTYTKSLNQAGDNGIPLEWNDLIESGKTGIAASVQPQSHPSLQPAIPDDSPKEGSIEKRLDIWETNDAAMTPELPGHPLEKRTYAIFLNNSKDKTKYVEGNGFIESGKDSVTAMLQPERQMNQWNATPSGKSCVAANLQTPKQSNSVQIYDPVEVKAKDKRDKRKTKTPDVMLEPQDSVGSDVKETKASALDSTETNIRCKKKLFGIFPVISDSATRRKNRMDAAKERRRMLDDKKQAKLEKTEKKSMFKRYKKATNGTTTDSHESPDEIAYVPLSPSPTTGLLELAEKFKQKGLPTMKSADKRSEEAGQPEENIVKDQLLELAKKPNQKVSRASKLADTQKVEVQQAEPKCHEDQPQEVEVALSMNNATFEVDGVEITDVGISMMPDGVTVLTDQYPRETEVRHGDAKTKNSDSVSVEVETIEIGRRTDIKESMFQDEFLADSSTMFVENFYHNAAAGRGAEILEIDGDRVEIGNDDVVTEVVSMKDENEEAALILTREQVENILNEIKPVAVHAKDDTVLYKSFVTSIKDEIHRTVGPRNCQDLDVSLHGDSHPKSFFTVQDTDDDETSCAASEQFDQNEKCLNVIKKSFVENDEHEDGGFVVTNSKVDDGEADDGLKSTVEKSLKEHDRSSNDDMNEIIDDEESFEHDKSYEEKDTFIDYDDESMESDESLDQDESFETTRSEKFDDDYSVLSGPDAPGCNFYTKFVDSLSRWILPMGSTKQGNGGCVGTTGCEADDDISLVDDEKPNTMRLGLESRSSGTSGSESEYENGKPLPIMSMTRTLDDDDVFDSMEARFCGI